MKVIFNNANLVFAKLGNLADFTTINYYPNFSQVGTPTITSTKDSITVSNSKEENCTRYVLLPMEAGKSYKFSYDVSVTPSISQTITAYNAEGVAVMDSAKISVVDGKSEIQVAIPADATSVVWKLYVRYSETTQQYSNIRIYVDL